LNAKHVLIVEDNPHLRRILAGALEYHGYTVSEAATGEEAIVMAINENPKLILLDLTLPDMSGTEAARALKQNKQTAHIPIVGCSAHFGPEWRDQALRSGMVGYVQKPVPLREIGAIIEQFILWER
jgi:two-component system, cell cycle response regulator DivK